MSERAKIIYVYDALCGWCYGFSPVMTKLYNKYRDVADFEVVSGGMIIGGRTGPIGTVGAYIHKEYPTVENDCGVKFGEKFLEGVLKPGTAFFSSEKPAIAMAVFREFLPARTIEFASILQAAIYNDGIEPENISVYGKYAEKFNIPAPAFTEKMRNESFIKQAYAEFELARKMNVNGFPTLFIKAGEKLYVACRGYKDFESLDAVFSKLKRN